MRTAFIKALEEVAAQDPDVNLLTADLGFGVFEPFAARFPGQFLNVGVAEQNMTGVAAGMALSGKIVFTYSIANFPTLRCLEQIRNDVCYHQASVKVVSVGAGLAYGALGSSHHALEDIAIMRALPGMTVVAPGDPWEAAAAARAVAYQDGPCYLRLGKAGEPRVHERAPEFVIGKAIRVREGSDLTLISTGAMLHAAHQAVLKLKSQGISARLLSMHTVKPLDVEAVLQAAEETAAVMTVEEHSATGGLGGAVAEVLAQYAGRRAPLSIVGVREGFCRGVGNQEHLRNQCGLGVEHIVAAARKLVSLETDGILA
ncbi:MAG: transketolase [Elusimicrobia bacterium]|nr:transketolase [Elusimicrobiota bacterium]